MINSNGHIVDRTHCAVLFWSMYIRDCKHHFECQRAFFMGHMIQRILRGNQLFCMDFSVKYSKFLIYLEKTIIIIDLFCTTFTLRNNNIYSIDCIWRSLVSLNIHSNLSIYKDSSNFMHSKTHIRYQTLYFVPWKKLNYPFYINLCLAAYKNQLICGGQMPELRFPLYKLCIIVTLNWAHFTFRIWVRKGSVRKVWWIFLIVNSYMKRT